MKYEIYLVTNKINNKKYVGETQSNIGYKKRFERHCNEKPGSNLFHRALKKYGKENFILELIEDNISEENIDDKEKYYIKKYDTYFKNNKGYNMTYGGQGIHGYHHSIKTKEKISIKSHENWEKLRKENPEEYEKQCKLRSKNLKNKPFTEDHKKNISKAIRKNQKNGTYVNSFLGKHHTEKTKEIIGIKNSRKVGCFDINSNQIIKEFKSLHEATNYLLLNNKTKNKSASSRIAYICLGKGKQAYGYNWKYLD